LTYSAKSAGAATSPLGDEDEEFDTPVTIAAITAALAGLGHDVDLLGDGEPLVRKLLGGPCPEVVLNVAEGRGGTRSREARVPALLEMLKIAYTGADGLTLAVALDKACAKRLVRHAGVATPDWVLVENGDVATVDKELGDMTWPLFVKPCHEGSSIGVSPQSLVHDRCELERVVALLHGAYRQPLLVEEFIDGDELTVGVLGNRPPVVLGVAKIFPQRPQGGPFIYDLASKRAWDERLASEIPARLSPADAAAVERSALSSWRALGCRDFARFDFRLRHAVAYFLEANPLPSLASDSSMVEIAAGAGIGYQEFIRRIVDEAVQRAAGP
jgi:D-alanine-D-alanine ligase